MTVPVPIARTGLIRRMSNRLAGVGPSSLPSRLAELAFDLDLAPASAAHLQRLALGSSVDAELLLVHLSSPPQLRARLLEVLAVNYTAPNQRVLALSEAELSLCHAALGLRPQDSGAWGTPLLSAEVSEQAYRERLLRHSAGLYFDQLHVRLAAAAPREEVARLCSTLRDQLAEVAVPARFPDLPAVDGSIDDLFAGAVGVFHAAFSAEQGPTGLPTSSLAAKAARTADAARRLVAPLLADLAQPAVEQLTSLYLSPGPFGTRHRWRLLAVVAGDAPLLEVAALRRHLQQHLSMLDERSRLSLLCGDAGPIVLTETALAGLMSGRLFPRPLSGLALHAHSQLLVGEDVLARCPGSDAAPSTSDLRAEVASLVLETRSCWSADRGSLAVRDLLFGAWPSVLHVARGGDPSDSLASIHQTLSDSTDPALSRVGSAASAQGWGDPSCVDLSRSRELLREWGPTLLRLQEATVEAVE